MERHRYFKDVGVAQVEQVGLDPNFGLSDARGIGRIFNRWACEQHVVRSQVKREVSRYFAG
ncbi:hypothetical protein [Rhizobium sp. LEGMi135b]